MKNEPIITVVMPVYNGEKFLAQAVESILTQTFTDFELIAVNDGSTDRSADILESFQRRDPRVKIHTQPGNMGLVEALNTGCRLATGEYIARMDADDVSLSQRFEKQLQYMGVNPQVGVLGTWIDYIDEHDKVYTRHWSPPTSPSMISWALLFGPSLAHPTWMMRRKIGEQLGFYRTMTVEDYDFLVRASQITQIANVPEILLHYRFWSQSKSTINAKTEAPTTAIIMIEQLNRLLDKALSVEEGMRLQRIIGGRLGDTTPQQVRDLAQIIEQTYHQYGARFTLPPSDARKIATDTGVKLLTCAGLIAKQSPATALSIIGQSLKISPTASVQFIQKAFKNFRERRVSV